MTNTKRVLIAFLIGVSLFITYCLLPTKPPSKLMEALFISINKHQNYSFDSLVILIDYGSPIYRKRLWIMNRYTNELILNTHVSHAKNSGWIYVDTTSNVIGSKISSVGAFITENSYKSQYGKGEYQLGMRIKGLEKQNSNVKIRNIVFHSSYGLYSEGCFMTWPKTNKKIIDLTKNGSFVYVYHDK